MLGMENAISVDVAYTAVALKFDQPDVGWALAQQSGY